MELSETSDAVIVPLPVADRFPLFFCELPGECVLTHVREKLNSFVLNPYVYMFALSDEQRADTSETTIRAILARVFVKRGDDPASVAWTHWHLAGDEQASADPTDESRNECTVVLKSAYFDELFLPTSPRCRELPPGFSAECANILYTRHLQHAVVALSLLLLHECAHVLTHSRIGRATAMLSGLRIAPRYLDPLVLPAWDPDGTLTSIQVSPVAVKFGHAVPALHSGFVFEHIALGGARLSDIEEVGPLNLPRGRLYTLVFWWQRDSEDPDAIGHGRLCWCGALPAETITEMARSKMTSWGGIATRLRDSTQRLLRRRLTEDLALRHNYDVNEEANSHRLAGPPVEDSPILDR